METLTFYRKMANTNLELMKKYKVAVINKMKYDDIFNLYKINNLNFDTDVLRLKNFYNKNTETTPKLTNEENPKLTNEENSKVSSEINPENKPEEKSNDNLEKPNESPVEFSNDEYLDEKTETSWFSPSYLFIISIPIIGSLIYFNYSKINIYINGN